MSASSGGGYYRFSFIYDDIDTQRAQYCSYRWQRQGVSADCVTLRSALLLFLIVTFYYFTICFEGCHYSCLGFSMRPGVKEHWEHTDIRPKCSPELYSPANKDVCKPRWSVDVLKQQHSAPAGTAKGVALAAAGPAEGVASLVPAPLALAAKWRSALKPQVVATAFCVCITCTRGQIRCGFLNAFSSSSFQNVTAPVTSKLSWAIDRMSLLFFSSHAGTRPALVTTVLDPLRNECVAPHLYFSIIN